jgi:hypothetical protein
MMPRLQISQLAFDPEELADEVLHVRREVNDQLGALPRIQRRGLSSHGFQILSQLAVGFPKFVQKSVIQLRQTPWMVEIFESQSKARDESVSRMYVSLIFHAGFSRGRP